MAQELRFADPAFTCEVVLVGPAKALYEVAQPQFERLRRIRSLGLASRISDIAIHNRHSHAIGSMKIFNKLCQQPIRQGLPKKFLWAFWSRLCFGQTGHAALSYDSEKAVLLACHLDSGFKDKFRTLVQPVTNSVMACTICDKQCGIKAKDSAAATLWLEDLIQKNQWRRVHLWIAALKLIQDPRILNILKQQILNQDNTLGFSDAETIKMLASPECSWDYVFYRLNRLDYVVRDLAFAGTLGIRVDIDGLISASDRDHPDWELLRYLDKYLESTIYESIQSQTDSILFQRALANLLLSEKISLESLFGINTALDVDDDKLADTLGKTQAGREVFDHDLRSAWQTWPVNCFVDSQLAPCSVEQIITGRPKQHLVAHTRTKVTCMRMNEDHSLGLSMCYLDQVKRPAAKAFIKLCRSILLKKYPQLNPEHLTTALYEGLINRTCEHGLKKASKRCADLQISEGILRGAADVVNKRADIAPQRPANLSIRIGSFDYPLRGDLTINIMHAAVKGNDEVRKNLGVSVAEAAEILWSQILSWPSVYFGLRPSQKILQLLDEAQSTLGRQVLASLPSAQDDLELYTLLEALKHPDSGVSFRTVLPNLVLLKEDRNKENEYDVVSIALKEDKHVEVWVWGVTTEADIGRKRQEDHVKIQKLKDLLGNRWGGEVRTVENYVHKEDNDICCEIDGTQERRHY